MDKKNHIHFKDLVFTKLGLINMAAALGLDLLVSFGVSFNFRQWLGIVIAVVFYFSSMLTAVHTINKRIDNGEKITIEKR